MYIFIHTLDRLLVRIYARWLIIELQRITFFAFMFHQGCDGLLLFAFWSIYPTFLGFPHNYMVQKGDVFTIWRFWSSLEYLYLTVYISKMVTLPQPNWESLRSKIPEYSSPISNLTHILRLTQLYIWRVFASTGSTPALSHIRCNHFPMIGWLLFTSLEEWMFSEDITLSISVQVLYEWHQMFLPREGFLQSPICSMKGLDSPKPSYFIRASTQNFEHRVFPRFCYAHRLWSKKFCLVTLEVFFYSYIVGTA